jgi:hypothetical protein
VENVIGGLRLARLLLPILREWPDLWGSPLPPAWEFLTDFQKREYVDAVTKMRNGLLGVHTS